MAGGALDVADRMSATFLTKNSAKSSTEWPDVDAAVGGRSRTLSLVHMLCYHVCTQQRLMTSRWRISSESTIAGSQVVSSTDRERQRHAFLCTFSRGIVSSASYHDSLRRDMKRQNIIFAFIRYIYIYLFAFAQP